MNSPQEQNIDFSKLTDFEISMLIIERDNCQHKAEQIDELLNKIGEAKGYSDAGKTPPPIKNEPSQLPGTDFDKLPWKSYQTKQAAKPDEAAWIFSNAQGAEALLSTLKSKDGKATIGSSEYQLQGAERQFIARKPVK